MENWKDVPGFNGFYQVSDLGNVKNKRGKYLRLYVSKGYCIVVLSRYPYKTTISVHLVVLYSFKGIDLSKRSANHIDGNKLNNCLENLEWVTRSENIKHAYLNGLKKPTRKLSTESVIEIRKLLSKESMASIGRKFNVSSTTIMKIRNGVSWSNV